VELLRQLMERQALHRVDQGDLTDEQEERLGATLMLLHDHMSDLCARCPRPSRGQDRPCETFWITGTPYAWISGRKNRHAAEPGLHFEGDS
jgi:hypothetical protein